MSLHLTGPYDDLAVLTRPWDWQAWAVCVDR